MIFFMYYMLHTFHAETVALDYVNVTLYSEHIHELYVICNGAQRRIVAHC